MSARIIAFDLDDVLCWRDHDEASKEKYKFCKPIPEMISLVNMCYDQGHNIIIYTARGMSIYAKDKIKIYNELFSLTKNHLDEWGIKYHQLVMGKYPYDLLIDDKAVSSFDIKSFDDIKNALKRSKQKRNESRSHHIRSSTKI